MTPAATSNRRSSTRWGWLSCSKRTVTRPAAVRGSNRSLQGRLGLGDAHEVLDILILLPLDPLGFGQAIVSVLG